MFQKRKRDGVIKRMTYEILCILQGCFYEGYKWLVREKDGTFWAYADRPVLAATKDRFARNDFGGLSARKVNLPEECFCDFENSPYKIKDLICYCFVSTTEGIEK